MRFVLALVVMFPLLVAGCAGGGAENAGGRAPLAEGFHGLRLAVYPFYPPIVASRTENLGRVEERLRSVDPAELAGRRRANRVTVDALPFLTETVTGRRFLAATGSRVLVRGQPAEACPAVAVAEGPAGSPRDALVREAMGKCLAQLGEQAGRCGCQVIALDDTVLVPQEELAYATRVSARLFAPDLRLDLLLVAEETPGGEIVLRDIDGEVARLRHRAGGMVSIVFPDTGTRFEGRAIRVGFRRGRIAERIYAATDDGRRLSLLIGFEPAELVEYAGAWLAWPRPG